MKSRIFRKRFLTFVLLAREEIKETLSEWLMRERDEGWLNSPLWERECLFRFFLKELPLFRVEESQIY
jgi:hypothetical protein